MATGIRISPEVITKTPQEVLKIPMSFVSEQLQDGETITSVDFVNVLPPGDLEATGAASGTDVILTLEEGTAATDYWAVVLATTSNGQKLHQAGRVRVDEAVIP